MSNEAVILILIGVLIGIAVVFIGDMIHGKIEESKAVFPEANKEKIVCCHCGKPIGEFIYTEPIETCGSIDAVGTPEFYARIVCFDCLEKLERDSEEE